MTELGSFKFACNVKDQCWFNGKACRRMGNDEWHKFFPDDERFTDAPTLRCSWQRGQHMPPIQRKHGIRDACVQLMLQRPGAKAARNSRRGRNGA